MFFVSVIKFFLIWTLASTGLAEAFVVGEDERIDVSYADQKRQMLGRSVGAIVDRSYVINQQGRLTTFQTQTLQQRLEHVWKAPLCAYERFIEQPTLSDCSGILIEEQFFMTARHCIFDESDCKKKVIVFDYTERTGQYVQMQSQSIFSCNRIVSGSHGYRTGDDWVILELDRPAVGRQKVRVAAAPLIDSEAFVLGTPSGLPLKYMPGAIKKWTDRIVEGFFDSAVYASGSPLFNSANELIGILTNQSQPDFTLAAHGCVATNKVKSTSQALSTFQNIRPILSQFRLYLKPPESWQNPDRTEKKLIKNHLN